MGRKKGHTNMANGFILVDPARIRFQHSRIHPFFSGCGRSVTETLDAIRRSNISASDLPPIQVIPGPDDDVDGPWYYSLNNQSLWVLKRCRDERLLDNNQIRVHVRPPKSATEAARYMAKNCVLEATIMQQAATRSTTKESEMLNSKAHVLDPGPWVDVASADGQLLA